MHIGGLKTSLVKEGHELEVETLFREMRAAIAHGEPDCLYYSLLKSRTNDALTLWRNSIATKQRLMRINRRHTGRLTFPRFAPFSKAFTSNILM